MKHFSLLLFSLILILAGCTNNPIKDDVANYARNTIPLINTFDSAIGKKLDEIGAEKDKTVFVAKIKSDLLPFIQDFRRKITAIKPVSQELQDVHRMYTDVVASMEDGVRSLMESIEKKDQTLYKSAIDKITSGQKRDALFKQAFTDLAKKYGITLQ